jgi:hypothetical protein
MAVSIAGSILAPLSSMLFAWGSMRSLKKSAKAQAQLAPALPSGYRMQPARAMPVPASPQEKAAICDIYRQNQELCKKFVGDDEHTTINMTITSLKKVMPQFSECSRSELKDLVRRSIA